MQELSEVQVAVQTLSEQLTAFADAVQVTEKAARAAVLEETMAAPGFWDDQASAQAVINETKGLKAIVEPYQSLRNDLDGVADLAGMAAEDAEAEAELLPELIPEVERLQQAFAKLEVALALSGPYDASDVFLSVQPGAGGTDACDWAEMMVRMYSNYCANNGYSCDIVDFQPGAEAGIKSATLHIQGDHAYGYFKSEMGTHRLVRMSPFNSSGTRETSFAAVEVTPELPDAESVSMDDIDESEFRIDTYRASGAGGQHVNKTDSAVRVTHIATGIVVSCQSERSQIQNRQKCWKMMVAKLQQLKEAERLSELKDLAGERGTIGWGHQIRSYVLQPSQLITDLRTRLKVSNAQGVLDGDIQQFIDEYLRWRLQQG